MTGILINIMKTKMRKFEQYFIRKFLLFFYNKKEKELIINEINRKAKSNGTRYYEKSNVKIAVVSDEFFFKNYENVCELNYINNKNWKNQIDKSDAFMFVTPWHGLNNEWTLTYKDGSANNALMLDIFRYCNQKGCPIIFYSKEDPPNYDVFLNFAKYSDYIFTTSEECVIKYKEDTMCDNIYTLQFATNPEVYNPVGRNIYKSKKSVIFAGSWIKKYPQRIEEQKKIFNYAKKYSDRFVIVDRNFHRNSRAFFYPIKFIRNIIPNVSYVNLSHIYKCFDYCINLNSVLHSKTMFSSRAYDALASGNIVISNDSVGMRRCLPEILITKSKNDFINSICMSEPDKIARKIAGIRRAYSEGTVYERFQFILEKTNLSNKVDRKKKVAVVVPRNNDNAAQYVKMFYKQSYKEKVLILGEKDEMKILECDMITFWSDNILYEEHYLEDLVNGFKYTNCDYITIIDNKKETFFYTDTIDNKYLTIFWSETHKFEMLQDLKASNITLENGFSIYTDQYKVGENFGILN